MDEASSLASSDLLAMAASTCAAAAAAAPPSSLAIAAGLSPFASDLLSFSASPSLLRLKLPPPFSPRHPHTLRSSCLPAPRITSPSHSSQHDDMPDPDAPASAPLLDRRELLASSVAGLSLLSPHLASASPVVPPDLSSCNPATIKNDATVICCIPEPKRPIIDFSFVKNPPKRIRRPANLADAKYIAKYNKAYELMKALPEDDPRSFKQQADVHCAFCNEAYTQPGYTSTLQIHFSWLFFPWHRWYLYYHERILGSLIGDPTFALPVWTWSDQVNGGNVIPAMFTKEGTAIYDPKRNQSHLPPTLVALNYSSTLTGEELVKENLNLMYQAVVNAKIPQLFMGGTYSAGDSLDGQSLGGTLELGPHTAVHVWGGDPRETYKENLGNFYSAGRDPLFYSHHCNVDRIWSVWNTIGGRRKDHTDDDFLNAEFVFYDENADMIRVKVKDCLNSAKLGIFYEPVPSDQLWLNFAPAALSTGQASGADRLKELGAAADNKSSTNVGKKLASQAGRPSGPPQKLLDTGLTSDEVEEVLVLEGVEIAKNKAAQLAVFINLPDADDNTPLSIAEYVGSFNNIPHFGPGMTTATRSTTLRFGITDNLKKLGITDVSNLVVTVVSKGADADDTPVTIKGIRIEYQ